VSIPIERETLDILLVPGYGRLAVLEVAAAPTVGVADRVLLTGLRFVNLELSTELCLE
jgi:hypothetical protein